MECSMSALMKNGLKATTMDSIASSMQMSKRTLYEIFGSKEELFIEVLKHFNKKMEEKLGQIFANSSNVMEAIIKCFLFNRDLMSIVSAEFVRDLQEVARQHSNECSDSQKHRNFMALYDVLQRGVKEGYFIDGINLMVQCRMLILQMEALKHTEELFPEDITLLEVYDNIIVVFLRGISSRKGLDELEKFLPSLSSSQIF